MPYPSPADKHESKVSCLTVGFMLVLLIIFGLLLGSCLVEVATDVGR